MIDGSLLLLRIAHRPQHSLAHDVALAGSTTRQGNTMRSMTRIALTLAAAVMLTGIAGAKPALDDAGKCRDNGKFVKQSMCETAAAAKKCRDITTKKFAKCDAPNTEPVPSNSAAKPK
jgi:hypothetical protein